MALPTASSVSTGIRFRWESTPINATIPVASVYLGRSAEQTAFPRARLTVEESSRELTSGVKTICKYLATIEVYFTDGTADTMERMIEVAMSWNSRSGGAWPMPSGSVISSSPVGGGMTAPTGERLDGKDIVKLVSRWEILAEGERENIPE
jgi:hypothetical protein